ncbi:hypothetical protein HDV01_000195 [Terramyces sp. JEL0728]|nr:hypothetical protein HDV01_000195 [Terramyces sp. JEL0728]
MVSYFTIVLAMLSSISAAPSKGRYHGDQVFRVTLDTPAQKDYFHLILKDRSLKLDVWTDHTTGNVIDVRVPQSSVKTFQTKLNNLSHSIVVENVQELVDSEKSHSLVNKATTIYSDYQDTATLVKYLQGLPGATPISLGSTYGGNTINGIKFGTGAKTIVFNGGREWISPAVTTYVADFLLSSDPQAVALRNKFTFHVIPVLNPDGYAYTRDPNGDRMWRKNMEPNPSNPSCAGTDINRNFSFKWSEPGASSDECDETYYGSGPLSTKEAKALDTYVKSLKNVVNYLDLHSYSQLWLYPWGYTQSPSPDHTDHAASAAAGVKALNAVNKVKFTAEQSDSLYQTSGTTDDHFYATAGVKYSMTIELRDTGNNGFILPANQIVPSGKETVAGLIAFWAYQEPTLELDIWKDDMNLVDIRVTKAHVTLLKQKLNDFHYSILIDDVEKLVEMEQVDLSYREKKRALMTADELFSGYQDTDTMLGYLNNLPGTQPLYLGSAYNGNPISGIKFGKGTKNVVINGGIHAREWISPAVTTFAANFLLGADPLAVDMREKFTFHVIPVLNPDGYAYTRNPKGERFWRKNREPNVSNANCTGTDINRNFQYMWGNGDTVCGEGYAGPAPLSSKEAKALNDYVGTLQNVVAYLDIHSYSQLWLYPYGWTNKPSPDSADQMAASKAAVASIKSLHGTEFIAEPEPLKPKPKKSPTMHPVSDHKEEVKPFILNLVPYITPILANTNSATLPFRDRFELEYNNAYLEIAKSIPRIKYKPLNLSNE